MPPLPWKTISSRVAYQNPWITLREDIAELPDGKKTLYGVVQCAQVVGVLPFIDDDHILLVRQYRYVYREDHRWEIPAGGARAEERPLEAAQRELQEETGYQATDMQFICTFYPSVSVMHAITHLYTGRGLKPAQVLPDETEFLEVEVFPFKQALQMVLDSEIRDAITVIALLHADRLRTKG